MAVQRAEDGLPILRAHPPERIRNSLFYRIWEKTNNNPFWEKHNAKIMGAAMFAGIFFTGYKVAPDAFGKMIVNDAVIAFATTYTAIMAGIHYALRRARQKASSHIH